MRRHAVLKIAVLAIAYGLLATVPAMADELYGRIRGTVSDPTGAVIPNAKVTATNVGTGIVKETTTASDGTFEFLTLAAPATYKVTAVASGFKTYEAAGIALRLAQVFVLNITMEVGTVTQHVVVEANPLQVDTTTMQLGGTLTGSLITDMPLNGRNWVQLQQIFTGVVGQADGRGQFATNGSQTQQNSFLVNGVDTNDLPLNTPLVIPSPDAIGEVRMITNTINPEYGRNSGAIMSATIKSGQNSFHGVGFDFYRDTALNARNFFSLKPAVFHRHQFGGAGGGPIIKDKTFFFFSYQGHRQRIPQAGGVVPVFTSSQRNGIFPELASSNGVSPIAMKGEDGLTHPAGTPYSTLFPTGHIPSASLNPISVNLMNQYVPLPNVGTDYQFNPVTTGINDQFITRIDHNISTKDNLWGYFMWQRAPTKSTLPFTGATLPGFGDQALSHVQQYVAAWNHTFGPGMLNELRGGYTRLNYATVFPQKVVDPASVGFTGIHPQLTTGMSLPFIGVTGLFSLGFSTNGPQPRIDQTYQATDNFSWIVGRHTLKFGFDMRRFQVYNAFSNVNNGSFTFGGEGTFSTGLPGADFLLGIPDSYLQGSGDIINVRTQQYYIYAQDQFKVRPNLTLTYGAGWTIDTPMVNNYHDNHGMVAFRPGQPSVVFPTAPVGYVFQGDPGVQAAGVTKYKNIGPRVGFAWSPDLGWLSGGPGKLSIRGGYGIYFNRTESETHLQFLASPPFGIQSAGIGDVGGSPSFADPFSGWMLNPDGSVSNISIPNKYPYFPTANVDFDQFLPMSLSVVDPRIDAPYAQSYNLTVERQVRGDMLVRVSYVGMVAHRLLIAYELNPGIRNLDCAASSTCRANRLYQNYYYPNNFIYPGDVFGSVGNIASVGNSNYNSAQVSIEKRMSHGLQFQASYTWARSMDDGSGFENSGFGGGGFGGYGSLRGTNPIDRHRYNYGPSIFDATQRFVISYLYELPSVRRFKSLEWMPSRLTDGWKISGITTLQTGFPIDVINSAFRSLRYTAWSFYQPADVPDYIGGNAYYDPRTSAIDNVNASTRTVRRNYWFNPNAFRPEAYGTFGNAGRNLMRGPGLNNFDFGLYKDTKLSETTRLELRFEFYNLFNHVQFRQSGLSSNINSSNFGRITAAWDPRLIQFGAKFHF